MRFNANDLQKFGLTSFMIYQDWAVPFAPGTLVSSVALLQLRMASLIRSSPFSVSNMHGMIIIPLSYVIEGVYSACK